MHIYDKVKPKLRTYVHVRVLYAYIGSKYEYFRTMTYMDNCHVPCFLLKIAELAVSSDTWIKNYFGVKSATSNLTDNDFHLMILERVTWTIWCNMDFTYFPVDKQVM